MSKSRVGAGEEQEPEWSLGIDAMQEQGGSRATARQEQGRCRPEVGQE